MAAGSFAEKITPSETRAARALLGWTQRELAQRASLRLYAVVDFEHERFVSAEAVAMIRFALEDIGVEFIGEKNGCHGVRLRKPEAASQSIASARSVPASSA